MIDCERFTQIAQDKWATVSKSLRSLRGNEGEGANRSGCSRQMSDCERFAQVPQRKWANERFSQKILGKKSKILFLICFTVYTFFYFKKWVIRSFPLFWWTMWANHSGGSPKICDHERFAQVSQIKWAIVSELLKLLTKNEWMSESLIFLSKSLICSFLGKKWAIRSENRLTCKVPVCPVAGHCFWTNECSAWLLCWPITTDLVPVCPVAGLPEVDDIDVLLGLVQQSSQWWL